MDMSNIITMRESDGNTVTMEIHSTLRSTADLARKYAKEGYPDRFVVFSERQLKTNLTGNKDKDIETEYGTFVSLILRPSFFPSQASLLGAMTAAAMISALEEHTSKRLGLGWVSDVYCEGVKIGGSNIEGKLDTYTTYEYLIVNFAVKLEDKNFPPRITDIISEVFESDNSSISCIIAKNILKKFFVFYSDLKNSTKYMDIYCSRFALSGVVTKCEDDQKKKNCTIYGVKKESGALVVFIKDKGLVEINSPSRITMPKKIRLKKHTPQQNNS